MLIELWLVTSKYYLFVRRSSTDSGCYCCVRTNVYSHYGFAWLCAWLVLCHNDYYQWIRQYLNGRFYADVISSVLWSVAHYIANKQERFWMLFVEDFGELRGNWSLYNWNYTVTEWWNMKGSDCLDQVFTAAATGVWAKLKMFLHTSIMFSYPDN